MGIIGVVSEALMSLSSLTSESKTTSYYSVRRAYINNAMKICKLFTHCVKLHFRSISLTDVSFDKILKSAQKVYAQYGIEIRCESGQSLLLTKDQLEKFDKVDGVCEWTITSGEYAGIQKLGPSTPTSEIRVYFIKEFSEALRGCGGHAPNQPACICAASGTKWTMAHEVGHVLLGSSFRPVHSRNKKNLMYSSTSGITAKLPTLTGKQVAQMKKSPYCFAC